MLFTVQEGEIEEALELMEIIREQCCVVSLAHGSHLNPRDGCPKATLLCTLELLIVVNFVHFATVGPSLLHPELIFDGPHGLAILLTVGSTVGESEIPVTDSL